MIKQVKCTLAVYDTTHLTSQGTYWATPTGGDSFQLLESIHALFKQTNVHTAPMGNATIGGVVVSGGKVAIARLLDGANDERGRQGRFVFAYLVVPIESIINLDLQYFIKSQCLKSLQTMAAKGGRLTELGTLDLSPVISSKELPGGNAGLQVAHDGSFLAAKMSEALAFCQTIIGRNSGGDFAIGLIDGGNGCTGVIAPYPLSRIANAPPVVAPVAPVAPAGFGGSPSRPGSPPQPPASVASIRSSSKPTSPINPKMLGVAAIATCSSFILGFIVSQMLRGSDRAEIALKLTTPVADLLAGEAFSVEYDLQCDSTASVATPFQLDLHGQFKGALIEQVAVNKTPIAFFQSGESIRFNWQTEQPRYATTVRLSGRVLDTHRDGLALRLEGSAAKIVESGEGSSSGKIAEAVFPTKASCKLSLRLAASAATTEVKPDAKNGLQVQLSKDRTATVAIIVKNIGPSSASKVQLVAPGLDRYDVKFVGQPLSLKSGEEQEFKLNISPKQLPVETGQAKGEEKQGVVEKPISIDFSVRCEEKFEATSIKLTLVAPKQPEPKPQEPAKEAEKAGSSEEESAKKVKEKS